MKIYITAHAKSIRDIKSSLVNHVDQIEENFIKLLIAPNVTTRNHWQGEIASQIYKIRKTTGRHKLPSASDIYKWVYTEQLPELTDKRRFKKMVTVICNIENFEYPDNLEYLHEQFLDKISQYYEWLANELSIDGFVDRFDIFNKLDELL